ncbi:MAG: condensation domain-containing protein [Chloroflexota bacterium]
MWDAPLLHIQRWFLHSKQKSIHHFNQAVLLTIKKGVDEVFLKEISHALLCHHDALRFQYRQDESGWNQAYLTPNNREIFNVVDLQGIPIQERAAEIEKIGAQTQASLDPLAGDLVRFIYFKVGNLGREETHPTVDAHWTRLLIVIHHLAVDGVSWHILIEDLTTLLDRGQLPPKTSSYRDWAEQLQAKTAEGFFDAHINDWLHGIPDAILPLDNPDAVNTVADSHNLWFTLSHPQTEHLLRTLPKLHDVTLDAVVLTALTETLVQWSGQSSVSIKFESHGRQALFETVNLNRTVGWFTSTYPLTIPQFYGSAVKRIRYTLEQLRQVTDGGISFGALRYFHPDKAVRTQFEALPVPWVTYNYLGQRNSLANQDVGFASESIGQQVSSSYQRDTLLDSNASVINGQLRIRWTVTPQIQRETAESLFGIFRKTLDTLIAESLHLHEHVVIPSDFADSDLSLRQLEALMSDQEDSLEMEYEDAEYEEF